MSDVDDKRSAAFAMTKALRALGRLPPERPLATDGGELVLRPRAEGLQEKALPTDQIVKKLIQSRDKLRVLEQRVNASGLSQDEKRTLEAHITEAYDAIAALSAFFSDDALPAHEEDRS